MRWRNDGPSTAENIVAELGSDSGVFVVTGAGTSGWPCEPSHASTSFVCRGASLPAGGEAHMVVTLRAPARGSSLTLPGRCGHDARSVRRTTSPARDPATRRPRPPTFAPPREQTHARPRWAGSMPLIGGTRHGSALNVSPSSPRRPDRSSDQASGEGWSCEHPTHRRGSCLLRSQPRGLEHAAASRH